jgi:hypothetical protein
MRMMEEQGTRDEKNREMQHTGKRKMEGLGTRDERNREMKNTRK